MAATINTKEDAITEYTKLPAVFPEFGLTGIKCWARVISIYDADTITVIMPLAGTYWKFSLRVLGIDAAEIKSKQTENKLVALKARNRMFELVTGTKWEGSENAPKAQLEAFLKKNVYVVWVECAAQDKYGRTLASIYTQPGSSASFADLLISEGFAYAYGGATKLSEADQMKVLGTKIEY